MEHGWTKADEDGIHERLLDDAHDRFSAVMQAAACESRLGAVSLALVAVISATATVIVSLINPWMVEPWVRQGAIIGVTAVGVAAVGGLVFVNKRFRKWILAAHGTFVRDTGLEMERYRHALERIAGAPASAPGEGDDHRG